MNNKGMTTVELITSFALASIVFIILFNIVLSLKDIYITSGLKTELLIEQANLSKRLNSVINSSHEVTSVLLTDYQDNYNLYTLTVSNETHELAIDETNKKIIFDDYTYELDSKSSISDSTKYTDWTNVGDYVHLKDNLLVIDIPISNTQYKENMGVKVVYQTNGTEINTGE